MATLRNFFTMHQKTLKKVTAGFSISYAYHVSILIKKLIACYVVSITSLEVEKIIKKKLRISIMYWKFCLHPCGMRSLLCNVVEEADFTNNEGINMFCKF
jgi:hypothetical protein